MSLEEVEEYLAAQKPEQRAALEALRVAILAVLPDAEQDISYGAPVFRLDGKNVAGISAAARHVSYLPHSGGVIAAIDPGLLAGFETSKAAVKVPLGATLPADVIVDLIAARRAELGV